MIKIVKCLVWDLDNTIWPGTLLEDNVNHAYPEVIDIIKELDSRGILLSISSKNNYEHAKEKLEQLGLWDYFLYPQINWEPKSEALETIAKLINIGIDSIAFIDDQEFELEEVKFKHPDVLCINANKTSDLLEMKELTPQFRTEDSKNRRLMYKSDIERNKVEKEFVGTDEEFLKTLNMTLTISKANQNDLARVEELTIRTHQLNSTGYVYSHDELLKFINHDDYIVLVVQLDDKYGKYGKIGLALIQKHSTYWELNLLLMSCRVVSKGIGTVLLAFIMNLAFDNNMPLRARLVPTDRNRIMYITYKMNGFIESDKIQNSEFTVLEADVTSRKSIPEYINLVDDIR